MNFKKENSDVDFIVHTSLLGLNWYPIQHLESYLVLISEQYKLT